MAEDAQVLKCIILTLRNELAVVPNAAVAEIISVQDIGRPEDAPPWFLGKAHWRGVDLPVVSFEAAGGGDAQTVNINTQVAVLYSVSKEEDKLYPYVGVAMSGVPHVSRFTREQIRADIEALNTKANNPMAAQRVRINGAAASILDIHAMEDMLKQVVKH
jgi:chemosensory pili system protein ChpC